MKILLCFAPKCLIASQLHNWKFTNIGVLLKLKSFLSIFLVLCLIIAAYVVYNASSTQVSCGHANDNPETAIQDIEILLQNSSSLDESIRIELSKFGCLGSAISSFIEYSQGEFSNDFKEVTDISILNTHLIEAQKIYDKKQEFNKAIEIYRELYKNYDAFSNYEIVNSFIDYLYIVKNYENLKDDIRYQKKLADSMRTLAAYGNKSILNDYIKWYKHAKKYQQRDELSYWNINQGIPFNCSFDQSSEECVDKLKSEIESKYGAERDFVSEVSLILTCNLEIVYGNQLYTVQLCKIQQGVEK